MREIFTEIWESIRRNKLRTCLTGLAVSWGIFMLIVLLGAGNGVMNAFMGGLGDVSSNIMEVGAGYTGKPYNGLQEGRRMKLTDKDVQLTAGETFSEYIDEVIPYLSQSGLTMTYGKKHFSVNVIGTSPKYAELSKMTIYAGRFINKNDDAAKSIECVLNVLCSAIQEGLDERKVEKEKQAPEAEESVAPAKPAERKLRSRKPAAKAEEAPKAEEEAPKAE